MDLTAGQIAAAGGIGLVAGVVGGLAGIGGSLIMLPGLAMVVGFSGPDRPEHHLFMASAMVVNVLVSAPAALRHSRHGAVGGRLLGWVLPTMAAAIVAGVMVSERVSGENLQDVLAAFIAVYAVMNLMRAARKQGEAPAAEERSPWWKLVAIGGVTGLIGGLLGIGGGIVMVPMLQVFCKVGLRRAIGTSSAVMCVTAVIGSAMKVAGLEGHGMHVLDALLLAGLMGPTAMVGSTIGARLTHALPLNAVRVAISVLLLAAAAKLAF